MLMLELESSQRRPPSPKELGGMEIFEVLQYFSSPISDGMEFHYLIVLKYVLGLPYFLQKRFIEDTRL